MARDFQVPGESLVLVKGHNALSTDPSDVNNINTSPKLWELGLSDNSITLTPKFYHKDIIIDDFGPNTPVEVLMELSEVVIDMTLIHYDKDVLDRCIAEAMARNPPIGFDSNWAGSFTGAGTPLGNGLQLLTAGNFYISLNILSPQLAYPWHFPSTYIMDNVKFPLGTSASVVNVQWRAIPYKTPVKFSPAGAIITGSNEMQSLNTILWNHIADAA